MFFCFFFFFFQAEDGIRDWSVTGVQSVLFRSIYMERAWELAFEGKRWFDLVRRDSEEPGYWANSLRAHDPNVEKLHPLADFKKRFPIPQTQINANPALTQNSGY